MTGLIALLGSGEYLQVMQDTDVYLLKQTVADGRTPRVICLPTAAGAESSESINRWMRMGEEHFSKLGAYVRSLRLIDREGANNPDFVSEIEKADLVYFSGGNPIYLFDTLRDTSVWEAVLFATSRGSALAGCSAGAMFLGEFLPDLRAFSLRNQRAFSLLPGSHIFPHFDKFASWRGVTMPVLQYMLEEGEYALGLDEDTSLVGKLEGSWQVMGRQRVHVITRKEIKSYAANEWVTLPL